MRDKLVETATPGQELMAGTLRDRAVYLDAEATQAVHDGLALDEVLRTPVHIEVSDLLIELGGIGKDSIVGSLGIETEDGTTERAKPSKLIEMLKYDIKCLVSSP
jgi:hypothetical protein